MLNKGKTVLFEDVFFLNSIWQKARGLMFSRKITGAYIFVFEKKRRMDMHMMFVFFPIDVLFLDENKRIVEMKENFLPFSFYYSKNMTKYVIELPHDSIKKFKLKLADALEF